MIKNLEHKLFLVRALLAALIVNSAFLSYRYTSFYYGGKMMESFDCVGDCDAVMMSKYSLIWGVPVPVFGLLYFIGLAVLFQISQKNSDKKRSFEIYLGIGLLIALSFLYILYFKLHMVCKFCLFSHIALFAFAGIYFKALRNS